MMLPIQAMCSRWGIDSRERQRCLLVHTVDVGFWAWLGRDCWETVGCCQP